MPLPFDATLKDLAQRYPDDWLAQLNIAPAGPVQVLSPDLSTLTAFADIVLHLGDRLLHLDFQSGPDANLPRRVLVYNVLLYDQYDLPVHTVVVLLRPRAQRSDLTGRVRYEAQPGRGGLEFTFEIVRLWEQPVDRLLAGGLGTLPLAPLGQLPQGATPEEGLPGVIARLVDRLTREAPAAQAAELLTAAFVLTGMRLSQEAAIQLFQGVRGMHESTTYQYILDEGRAEGRAEGVRQTILRLGRVRFGPPDAAIESSLQGITDLERLERLSERLLTAASWQELLDTL